MAPQGAALAPWRVAVLKHGHPGRRLWGVGLAYDAGPKAPHKAGSYGGGEWSGPLGVRAPPPSGPGPLGPEPLAPRGPGPLAGA